MLQFLIIAVHIKLCHLTRALEGPKRPKHYRNFAVVIVLSWRAQGLLTDIRVAGLSH